MSGSPSAPYQGSVHNQAGPQFHIFVLLLQYSPLGITCDVLHSTLLSMGCQINTLVQCPQTSKDEEQNEIVSKFQIQICALSKNPALYKPMGV